jgi:hypothetical protein
MHTIAVRKAAIQLPAPATESSLDPFHSDAILENPVVGGCGASAPTRVGLRGLLAIRLGISSSSRQPETGLQQSSLGLSSIA